MQLILLSIFETETGECELQGFTKLTDCAGHIIEYYKSNHLTVISEQEGDLLSTIMESDSADQNINLRDDNGQIIYITIQQKELLAEKAVKVRHKLNPNAITSESDKKLISKRISSEMEEAGIDLGHISYNTPPRSKNEYLHVIGHVAPGSKSFTDPDGTVEKIIVKAVK